MSAALQEPLSSDVLSSLSAYCDEASESISHEAFFALMLRCDPSPKIPTMEMIGERFRPPVTKQRVHQLVRRSEAALRDLANDLPAEILPSVIATMRGALGEVFLANELLAVRRTLATQLRKSDPNLGAWSALPFKMITQPKVAIHCTAAPGEQVLWSWDASAGNTLLEDLDSLGRRQLLIRVDDLHILAKRHRVSAGVAQALPALLNSFRPVEGGWLYWGASYEAKAAALLTLKGLPISMPELIEAIQPGDAKDLRRRVLEDARFMRINLAGDVILRGWPGYTEYTKASTAAELMVRAAPGPTTIAEVTQALQTTYGMSSSSAKQALGSVKDRKLRRKIAPARRIYAPYNLVDMDGIQYYRLRVTPDLMRGSGKYVADSYFRGLGLQPGASGTFAHASGPISYGWIDREGARPFLGSLRRLLESLNARVGHALYVHIDGALSLTAFVRSESKRN